MVRQLRALNSPGPTECLFASIDHAIALIRAARPHLYRDWVADRYGLDGQIRAVLAALADLTSKP